MHRTHLDERESKVHARWEDVLLPPRMTPMTAEDSPATGDAPGPATDFHTQVSPQRAGAPVDEDLDAPIILPRRALEEKLEQTTAALVDAEKRAAVAEALAAERAQTLADARQALEYTAAALQTLTAIASQSREGIDLSPIQAQGRGPMRELDSMATPDTGTRRSGPLRWLSRRDEPNH